MSVALAQFAWKCSPRWIVGIVRRRLNLVVVREIEGAGFRYGWMRVERIRCLERKRKEMGI